MKYSNLKTELTINDWPIGFKTCKAEFWIESNKRGERACRRTENKTRTGWNKTKKGTYSQMVRIATDGSGNTYIISRGLYDSFSVIKGDMKHQHEYLPNFGKDLSDYNDLSELFKNEVSL